jgi:phosphatidylinositol-3-phosphatase
MRRLILALAGCLAMFATTSAAPTAASPTISHVIVIAFENHNRSQVIGTTSAPYLSSLAKTYGQATAYQNIAHPSLPNYLAVTGGTTAGVTNDCSPSSSCGSSGASIFSQLGTSWRSYEESMPKPCDKTNATPYAVRHNPAAYYRTLTSCTTRDVALPATLDLSSKLTWVTPNLCHDMHSTCGGSGCLVCQGDTWAKTFIPTLVASTEYKAGNTAILVWWDENNGSGSLPFIVISPYTHGVTDTVAMNHYTTLRTIQSLLGVACLQKSCNATSFATAFGL